MDMYGESALLVRRLGDLPNIDESDESRQSPHASGGASEERRRSGEMVEGERSGSGNASGGSPMSGVFSGSVAFTFD